MKKRIFPTAAQELATSAVFWGIVIVGWLVGASVGFWEWPIRISVGVQ